MKYRFIFLFSLITLNLPCQSIQISPDINVKNDFAYYVVSCEPGKIALLRDKSFRLVLQVLDGEFEWSPELSIELTGKKWRIIEICKDQNGIGIFYYTKLENESAFIYAKYDLSGRRILEKYVYRSNEIHMISQFRIQESEDENWFAIGFKNIHNKRNVVLYNRMEDSVYYQIALNDQLNYNENSISEMELSNEGNAYFFGLQKNQTSGKKKQSYLLTQIGNNGIILAQQSFDLDDHDWYDGIMAFNNMHKELVLAGLYAEKLSSSVSGYLHVRWKANQNISDVYFEKFSPELLLEWTGKNRKTASSTSTLTPKNISFDLRGGFQVFFESSKELSRRPYFSSTSDPGTSAYSRWIDYYYDDIIVACFNDQSHLVWDKVLHKKQYSQDDDAVFSSFYLFKNNAFLRLIFNDEIRNEGTVSEYVVRPDGNFIRKSLLNTSYKNLNLRFIDAIMLNAASLIVPSESNGKLNLVQINF